VSAPFGRFYLPGPTEVLPEVLAAQDHPMVGHRSTASEALLGRVGPGLQAAFRTARPVLIAAASATGFMEAAIRNGVRKKVLCLVNGAFSQRFAAIAAACEKTVHVAEIPLGETAEPELVRSLLRSTGADAVTVVHSESATGALAPLEAIAAAVREFDDVMLLVDAVTSLAATPVETDAWGLDFVLTGSQKAFALPPGLAFGAASPRLLERARSVPGRGLYFDLLAYDAAFRKRQTPYTPALSLLYALEAQLSRIAAGGGIEARWARHQALQQRVERWVDDRGADLGIAFLPKAGRRSWTVSCIRLPVGTLTGGAVAKRMESRGIVIGAGYRALKDTTFRIGHMGDHTVAGLEVVLGNLEEVLRRA
jgi:predicted phosphoserine aminotransferase